MRKIILPLITVLSLLCVGCSENPNSPTAPIQNNSSSNNVNHNANSTVAPDGDNPAKSPQSLVYSDSIVLKSIFTEFKAAVKEYSAKNNLKAFDCTSDKLNKKIKSSMEKRLHIKLSDLEKKFKSDPCKANLVYYSVDEAKNPRVYIGQNGKAMNAYGLDLECK